MIDGKIPRGCLVKSYCRNLCFEDLEMEKGWESHGARVLAWNIFLQSFLNDFTIHTLFFKENENANRQETIS